MRCVQLVVVSDELIETELAEGSRLQLPEQERADWIPAHQAVEEHADLLRLPDELPLNSRQQILALSYAVENLVYGDRRLNLRHQQSALALAVSGRVTAWRPVSSQLRLTFTGGR